jgi:microcystin-dependent protein
MKIYAGTVMIWPGTGTPPGWAACDGTILQKSQYPALWNVLLNKYGGDGITTFALPDFRGRVPVGVGPGPFGWIDSGINSVNQSYTPTLTNHGTPKVGTIGCFYIIALEDDF